MLAGCATAEGTARYRERLGSRADPGHCRLQQGLTISSIGMGTYLGDSDGETDLQYDQATRRSLELGSNVLDTAINYRCQRSERVIGRTLAALADARVVARDEVVVATKGGFFPFDGAPPGNMEEYIRDAFIRPGILKPEEIVAGCHAMTPAYLRHQLAMSLSNLGLERVDIYYLHNPETQLQEVPRPEFLGRIREAFACLEEEATAGRLTAYGTATWTGYRQPEEAPDYLSVETLIGIAREVGGEGHHFRAIQLPFNLAMPEALVRRNQPVEGEHLSTLEAAHHFGITVMASASVYQGQLTHRLPDIIDRCLPGLKTDAQRALQFVRSTPGITTALVGMKRVTHVEENLALAGHAPVSLDDYLKLFQREE